jgi:hypothetical protein
MQNINYVLMSERSVGENEFAHFTRADLRNISRAMELQPTPVSFILTTTKESYFQMKHSSTARYKGY